MNDPPSGSIPYAVAAVAIRVLPKSPRWCRSCQPGAPADGHHRLRLAALIHRILHEARTLKAVLDGLPELILSGTVI